MIKLIIFFRKPADVDAFEEHFANHHVPLIGKMPNVKRTAVTRAIGAPRGEAPYYLIHDVYFADLASLNYALNSPEGRATGADLMGFAREIVTLMFAEVWCEDEVRSEKLEVESDTNLQTSNLQTDATSQTSSDTPAPDHPHPPQPSPVETPASTDSPPASP